MEQFSPVSVITIEEAKGLEFDAVLVVDNYMNINEKYVAYTRALDNLIITTLLQASFTTGNNEIENRKREIGDSYSVKPNRKGVYSWKEQRKE